jgi:hypothetical protein
MTEEEGLRRKAIKNAAIKRSVTARDEKLKAAQVT